VGERGQGGAEAERSGGDRGDHHGRAELVDAREPVGGQRRDPGDRDGESRDVAPAPGAERGEYHRAELVYCNTATSIVVSTPVPRRPPPLPADESRPGAG